MCGWFKPQRASGIAPDSIMSSQTGAEYVQLSLVVTEFCHVQSLTNDQQGSLTDLRGNCSEVKPNNLTLSIFCRGSSKPHINSKRPRRISIRFGDLIRFDFSFYRTATNEPNVGTFHSRRPREFEDVPRSPFSAGRRELCICPP